MLSQKKKLADECGSDVGVNLGVGHSTRSGVDNYAVEVKVGVVKSVLL